MRLHPTSVRVSVPQVCANWLLLPVFVASKTIVSPVRLGGDVSRDGASAVPLTTGEGQSTTKRTKRGSDIAHPLFPNTAHRPEVRPLAKARRPKQKKLNTACDVAKTYANRRLKVFRAAWVQAVLAPPKVVYVRFRVDFLFMGLRQNQRRILYRREGHNLSIL